MATLIMGAGLVIVPPSPDALRSLAECAVNLLDTLDGDMDVEPNGDELDGSMGEDDFHSQNANWLDRAGCPVSDPGEDDDPAEESDGLSIGERL